MNGPGRGSLRLFLPLFSSVLPPGGFARLRHFGGPGINHQTGDSPPRSAVIRTVILCRFAGFVSQKT